MKQSDLNHLRRLLGWIRCDIGQSPAELQQTMIDVAEGLGHPEISPEAKARMVETYRRAESIPLYVRAAVKALEKALAAGGGGRGVDPARATAETRASIGLDLGAEGGPALAANRAHAAAYGVACRDTPAALPTLRRDDSGGASAARRGSVESASFADIEKWAAALGNRDWKWWDSCSFRRLTFEDGPDRRDGGALCGWVQPSDGHPDVSMAPGVREFIEAASPRAVAALCAELTAVRQQLAMLVAECSRADAQAGREVQRHFIYPEVLERARRTLDACRSNDILQVVRKSAGGAGGADDNQATQEGDAC
ncbi:hypothetical protein EUC41_31045 [Achromobacter denitrificans]|uniref:hypothetical protein n=1 Tax=Achromobacter denitrificans TaxID=32002 RepID=UPI00240D9A6C|nr:hypothetical protein [Achromobacter denitrificans]MDX3878156.1 hypothetical protein [Achromobacter sp.]WFC70353.1 hypothetical protein EUC41_31045 [Achromobacter denitrificans]